MKETYPNMLPEKFLDILRHTSYGMFPKKEIIIDGPDLFTGGYTYRIKYEGDIKENIEKYILKSFIEKYRLDEIDKIIKNNPATIIIFKNGKKSIVKAHKGEVYNLEKGICFALLKYYYGKNYYKSIKKICNGDLKDNIFGIRNIYFNDPLTVIIFKNGSKFFAKRKEVNWPEMKYSVNKIYVDHNDPEFVVGLLICKKIFGKDFYKEILRPIVIKILKDEINILQQIKNAIHANNKKKERILNNALKNGVCCPMINFISEKYLKEISK